LTFGFKKG